ncbi:ribonuclease catalytic domain-containing protein [Nocardioides perillae]|uniref:Exoribonuclease R n=1 Tax=Nocardioides perillae TaxID=1119534 RepID=A0A7Y9UKP5_9ACTN|nr:RNB domain-containing ribonuclease [Nocardioides perillae]NYG55603.1 exoribonuclease R [Nocardioides perillae]
MTQAGLDRQVHGVRAHLRGDGGALAAELQAGLARLHADLGLPDGFAPDVVAAAERATVAPRLPELDRTDLPFLTIDPEGARDLDQALHLERAGDGYRVHYAIADVAAFVTAGDPVDQEAQHRGETLYGAGSKVPLHPPAISEGAGSLLVDQVRPALLWTIDVDAEGEGTRAHVERALVRSRAQLTYDQAQEVVDGTADHGLAPELRDALGLLREVGTLRLAREAARGGVSLPLPEQEVDVRGEAWHLEFRARLPVEDWNAQISLLTGFAAASLMVYARVGILRTLPPPDPRDVRRLHRTARALGIAWPAEQLYPDFVRSLDPTVPAHAAMVVACTRLLRGSGYVAFDGELPEQPQHAGLASEYAHVTAPLRRLVDRYGLEVCVALCADEPVPAWVLDALPGLPATMRESGRRANQYESGVLDVAEAGALAGHVGAELQAVVVEVDDDDPRRGEVRLVDPAVEARVRGAQPLPLGEEVRVRVVSVDVVGGRVELEAS